MQQYARWIIKLSIMRKNKIFVWCCVFGRDIRVSTALGAIVMSCLAMPGSAHSAIVTETVAASLAPQATDFSDQQIGIQQFDPSLGALQSVEVILQGTGQMIQQYENRAPNSSSITFGQTLNSALTLPGGQNINIQQSENHTYSAGSFDHVLDFGGTSGGTYNYDVSASSHQLYVGDLAAFTGSGLAYLFLSGNATFQISDFTGNLIVSGSTTSGADVSVIYTYDAIYVPEPASYGSAIGAAAMLLGIVGVGFKRSHHH